MAGTTLSVNFPLRASQLTLVDVYREIFFGVPLQSQRISRQKPRRRDSLGWVADCSRAAALEHPTYPLYRRNTRA